MPYWDAPFSLYVISMVVRVWVLELTSMTNRDSSLIQDVNGRRNPEIILAFCIGMIILVILFHQEIPKIVAASSISADSCSMALVPDLVAKGRYFTVPTSTRIKNELARNEKLEAMAR